MPAMQFRTVNSPVGPLTLAGKDGRLMHLVMVDQAHEPSHGGWERDYKASQTQSSSSKSTSISI
jgi:methylated-DNA-[protein]-cysteine S-methyltransferase